MSSDEIDRAHREDYAYERACREAAFLLRGILQQPRMRGSKYRTEVETTATVLLYEADHIVAVWD